MAFREPAYNAWARAWRPDANSDLVTDITWTFLGYFRCQQRQVPGHFTATLLLEVPAGLSFKKSTQTPFGLGYRVQVAGWENQWARVYEVEDSAAGFANEHRTLLCDRPDDLSFDSFYGFFPGRVNILLEPPDGFFLMGTTPSAEEWVDPDQSSPQWKSDGSAT